jgi:hypothetical protein
MVPDLLKMAEGSTSRWMDIYLKGGTLPIYTCRLSSTEVSPERLVAETT